MKHLSETWIVDGYLDTELKRYELLAYLQHVSSLLLENKLFPHKTEIESQINALMQLMNRAGDLRASMSKELVGMDLKDRKLLYRSLINEGFEIEYIREVVQFALPHLTENQAQTAALFTDFDASVDFEPIGILPDRLNEGYTFLYHETSRDVDIYRYTLSPIALTPPELGIALTHVDRKKYSIIDTFSTWKVELTKTFQELPHPAVFLFRTPRLLPVAETLVPLIRIRLFKELQLLNHTM